MTTARVGRDHSIKRDNVSKGHFIEQLACKREATVANKTMEDDIIGNEITAGHGVEKAEGKRREVVGEVAGQHGVEGNGGAARHGVEDEARCITAAMAHVLGDGFVPSDDLGVTGRRLRVLVNLLLVVLLLRTS